MNVLIDDKDVWPACPVEYLWIYDKLIVAKKCGYIAGPAGIPVPEEGWYVVRPITNIRMMSRGASKMWLTPEDTDMVPDGYFWCEWFEGKHTSVDFFQGSQQTTVEGFRDNNSRLDRFSCWKKIKDKYDFPSMLGDLWKVTPWVNVEYIDNKIIEVHLRWNDDFSNHDADTIIPVWKDEPLAQPENSTWNDSPSGDRIGFWIINLKDNK